MIYSKCNCALNNLYPYLKDKFSDFFDIQFNFFYLIMQFNIENYAYMIVLFDFIYKKLFLKKPLDIDFKYSDFF